MIPEYFTVVGAMIASAGGIYYLYETIRGTAKPNRVTWLLWGLFPLITFVAQRVQGVEGASWASFVSGLTPLLVFFASFINRKAYWESTKRDYFCMLVGLVGIVAWALTSNPNLAILLVIFADGAAGVPTILKAYNHPETESWKAFAISSLGFGLSLLAVPDLYFQTVAFLIYLFVVNTLIALLSARKPAISALHIEP